MTVGPVFAVRTKRTFADPVRECRDHWQGDVGIEQGATNVADRGVNVGLGQATLAAQSLERGGETVGQAREHGSPFGVSGAD